MKTPIPLAPTLRDIPGVTQSRQHNKRTLYVEHNRTTSCTECGESFDAAHYDAEFCSPRCRKRRQRKLEKIDALLQQSIAAIDALATYHRRVGHDKAFDVVSRIVTRVTSVRDNWES